MADLSWVDWNVLWFVLLGVLLAGYAVLDGFDLGVGILHPFLGRDEADRKALVDAVGPVWDGNEVWLVTFGGAMFAAFPEAYATVFSGFYVAFMAIVFALIFRAVSIEFRSKLDAGWHRRLCDAGFFGSSLLATFLFGVSVGAAMKGVPLSPRGVFVGTVLSQIEPFSVSVGLMTVAMFMMHGAIYLCLKTRGDLQSRAAAWFRRSYYAFAGLFAGVTGLALATVPRATANFAEFKWPVAVAIVNLLTLVNTGRAASRGRFGHSFLSSCATIAGLVALFGVALFPNMVTSDPAPENSLTVYGAASSTQTLQIMALIVAVGMPFVISYTAIIYWTFRGRVGAEDEGAGY